jgi:hypothetical protein
MNRIHNKISNEVGNNQYTLQSDIQKTTQNRKGTNVVFAGDLNVPNQNVIETKLRAQKMALRAILDVYKNDGSLDNRIGQYREDQKERLEEVDEAAHMIRRLRELRESYRDLYGVSSDSEEEKDLNILEKSLYGNESLTEEEQTRLEQMGPLTEYQKSALALSGMEQLWLTKLEQAENGYFNDEKAIIGIKLERLKTHPMVDAQKEAISIIEEASRQVINMLTEEMRQEFDDKLKEMMEDAKKKREENQEKKEELERAKQENRIENKEREGQNGAVSEASVTQEPTQTNNETVFMDTDLLQQELQRNMADITKKQNLLYDELKGIAVDELI